MNGPTDIDGPELNSPDLGSWLGEGDTVVAEDVEDSPRDEPLLVDDYGLTDYEQSHPEPLSSRLQREQLDVPVSHRPVDPDPVAARGFPGRIVSDDDGASVAFGDLGGFAAEEMALHLQTQPLRPAETDAERLTRIEAEIHGLVVASHRIAEALRTIVVALQSMPTAENHDASADIQGAARQAHVLLLAAPLTTPPE